MNEINAAVFQDKSAKVINLTDSGVSSYVIVRGENATPTEITAANELQKYLKCISGAELMIVTDHAAVAKKEIIVGKTNREAPQAFARKELGEDGFVIRTADEKLWLIGGGDRGTVYSVYTFLEEYLGCRFYADGIEKIPEKKDIVLTGSIEDKQIPTFIFRDAGWYDYIGTDISVKRKINFNTWGRNLPKKVGGGISYCKGEGGHTFAAFIDPKEYFESHPEYFTMNEKGERVSDKQLCLTNPDVLRLTIEGVRRWLSEDPSAEIISISQNDTEGACLCENCKKVYEEEGGAFSGTLIRFVNAIAEDIAEDYPNVWVDTYAYSYTRSAPAKTKPAKNVMIRLCTMGCCFSHTHDKSCNMPAAPTYLDGSSNVFSRDLNDWAKICSNNFIYDYTTNYQHFILTFPDFHNLRPNFEYYARSNAIGIMAQGNNTSKSVEFGELRCYLLSKLLWNPYMSEEEFYGHMDDFLEGVYGPGGKYIRKYIELAEEITKDICFGVVPDPYVMYPLEPIQNHSADELPGELTIEMIKNYSTVDWKKYWNWYADVKENPITAEGEKLFRKAMELAGTGHQRKELDKIYCQVEYAKSYYYKKRLDVGEKNLFQMITQYIRLYPDAFTEDEKKNLPDAIQSLAREQVYAEYVKYNRAFAEKIISTGCTYLFEGAPFVGWENFHYAEAPVKWWVDYIGGNTRYVV